MKFLFDSLGIDRAENPEKEEKPGSKQSQLKKNPSSKTLPRPSLTLEQEYHNEVFHYLLSLTHTVERLEEIPFYLSRYPDSPAFRKQGINLHKWVQYHYSNFLINAVSIYDITLLLTNAIFMLGLPPKHCNDGTVTNNRKVQGTRVKRALENLNKATKVYREPRNLYVHRGRAPELETLDRFESFRFMQRAEEEIGIESEPIINPIIVDRIYASERRELIKAVKKETAKITIELKQLFDTLDPAYSSIWKQLK